MHSRGCIPLLSQRNRMSGPWGWCCTSCAPCVTPLTRTIRELSSSKSFGESIRPSGLPPMNSALCHKVSRALFSLLSHPCLVDACVRASGNSGYFCVPPIHKELAHTCHSPTCSTVSFLFLGMISPTLRVSRDVWDGRRLHCCQEATTVVL